ncbi:MAG: hypothetical protein R3D98_02775 [Candidatus Krumholzibacteriia bacterium]
MKKLLVLALVALMAAGALAQTSEDNMIGMFFTNDLGVINESIADGGMNPNTNFVNAFAPFNAYIVLVNPTVASVAAYETSVTFDGGAPFLLAVTGPNGWTNFGTPSNHLAGFQTPLPCADGAVLCTIQMLYTGVPTVFINLGAATPSSFNPPTPGIADGANPDNLIACPLTSDGGYVATINGDGVVATEAHSLSDVKALFD